MATLDVDGGGQVLHQHVLSPAHVAPVGLQQERTGVAGGLAAGAVVEKAAVATMRIVPHRIGALGVREDPVVGGQEGVAIDGDDEDDTGIPGQQGFLDIGKDLIGEGEITGSELRRVGAGDGAVIGVE